MTQQETQVWFENYKPEADFKPLTDLIARGKTVYIRKESGNRMVGKIEIATSGQSAVLPVGRIYGVGPLVPDLKPGMRVYFNFYANTIVYHEGVEYYMISELDVFGVLPAKALVLQSSPDKEGLRRRDLSVEEMPTGKPTQHEKEELEEIITKEMESVKKDAAKKIIIVGK